MHRLPGMRTPMRNEAHEYLEDINKIVCDDAKCVNCHRCVSLCPTRALKIIKSGNSYNSYKENAY